MCREVSGREVRRGATSLYPASLPGVLSLPGFAFAVSAASVQKILALAHHKGVSLYYFRSQFRFVPPQKVLSLLSYQVPHRLPPLMAPCHIILSSFLQTT